jgi:hypothetical protein
MSGPGRFLDLALYHARRLRWAIRPDVYARSGRVLIDDPIFIVGVQGSGATLLSRMLRRSPEVVTLSGNHRYWTGADEMQTALGRMLPAAFSGLRHSVPPHPVFTGRRGWVYASDELAPLYSRGEADYDESDARRFRRAIQTCIALNAPRSGRRIRFLDKSQSYALKIPLIRRVLSDTRPRFVALARDPYAMCWRAAARTTHLSREPLPLEDRLRVAAEHWANTYAATRDAGGVLTVRVEDLISGPEPVLRSICEFVDVAFDVDMLPAESHRIPRGTKRGERWYPMRAEVNSLYLREIPAAAVDLIRERVDDVAGPLGYRPPAAERP